MSEVLTSEQRVYKLLCKLRNEKVKDLSAVELEEYIDKHIHLLEAMVTERSEDLRRIKHMSEVVIAYSNEEYQQQAAVSEENTEIDGLAVGLNMLGEELASATLSLHEKEVLLKEIHHRVKNNLQLISSLLNLQANTLEDPIMIEKLRECQNRIQTIALVHKKLYRSDKLSRIDLAKYINEVMDELLNVYLDETKGVTVDLVLHEGIVLDLERCIPAGLIITELVMNVFKHAFDGTKDPKILLEMGSSNNLVTVKVLDNGKGLPEDFDFDTAQSMGLILIKALADQLEGEIKFTSIKSGTMVELKFSTNF